MVTKAIYNSQYRALVAHICATRKGRGLTQAELGRRIGVSRLVIQKIEACQAKLDLVRYVALCRILGLRAGRLLGRLEESSDEDDPLFTYQTLFQSGLVGRLRSDFTGHLLATFMHEGVFFGIFCTF